MNSFRLELIKWFLHEVWNFLGLKRGECNYVDLDNNKEFSTIMFGHQKNESVIMKSLMEVKDIFHIRYEILNYESLSIISVPIYYKRFH